MIPATEKRFPAICHLLAALVLALGAGGAGAEGSENYQAGLRAYELGDLAGAMKSLRSASDAGEADAQALLGYILDKAEFDEEAANYYRLAADQGNADGLLGLAMLHFAGDGVEKDRTLAARMLREAAGRGNMTAKRTLALAYIEKNADLEATDQTSEEARTLLAETAEGGYLPSMEALANAYATGGFGLGQDAGKAREWNEKIADIRKSAANK